MMLKILFMALQVGVLNYVHLGPHAVTPMVYYIPWLVTTERGRSRSLIGVALLGLLQDVLLFSFGLHLLAAVTALFVVNFLKPASEEQRPVPVWRLTTAGVLVYTLMAEGLAGWGVLPLSDIFARIGWHLLMVTPAALLVALVYSSARSKWSSYASH